MNKIGFSLIELMLATAIAGGLSVLMFTALYQLNKSVGALDTTVAFSEKALLLATQFEKDFSGVTAPNEFYERQKPEKKEPQSQTSQKPDKAAQKADNQQKSASNEPAKKSAAANPLQKIFYSINQDEMLSVISFITVNPLLSYWSDTSGNPQPRIVRVWYVVRPEKSSAKEARQSYALWRGQSNTLEYQDVKNTNLPEYKVAGGIQSIRVSYKAKALAKKSDQKDGSAQPQGPQKKETVQSDTWDEPNLEDANESKPLAPALIDITITFWIDQKKRKKSFTFSVLNRSELEQVRTDQLSAKVFEKLKDLIATLPPPPTSMAHNTHVPPSYRARR